MRTTLNLDNRIVSLLRRLAREQNSSMGDIASDLIRRGLSLSAETARYEADFPVFEVSENALPITLEQVQAAEDEAF